MGAVIQEFHKISFQTSNFLNSSKSCSSDSIMIGMKIAIIFLASAMISVPANAYCGPDCRICRCGICLSWGRSAIASKASEARNADYCKEELKACGFDLECIAKVLKNCPGITPNKI